MEKQKTGFWKIHPLLKAIAVLVIFYSAQYLGFYCINIPIIAPVAYVFELFYAALGLYIFGGLYGIWLDHGCHLKFLAFCLVFLVLIIIVSIDYFFVYVYPDWSRFGYFSWYDIHLTINYAYSPILSVLGGYILSRAISYFVAEHRKARGITD